MVARLTAMGFLLSPAMLGFVSVVGAMLVVAAPAAFVVVIAARTLVDAVASGAVEAAGVVVVFVGRAVAFVGEAVEFVFAFASRHPLLVSDCMKKNQGW